MVTQLKTKDEEIDLNREYTVEEFAALPDDGNRYELIEGKLVMSPATKDKHGRIMRRLLFGLMIYLQQSMAGEIWATTGFYLGKKPNGKDNVLEPDLGFIVAQRVPLQSNDYLPYPDLAIEIWSQDSDLKTRAKRYKAISKLEMFLKAGAQIAWRINPIEQTVSIYQKGQEGPVKVLRAGDNLECAELLPGFSMPVKALFE